MNRTARTTAGLAAALAISVAGAGPALAASPVTDDSLSVGELAAITKLKNSKTYVADAPGPKGDRYTWNSTSPSWSVVLADPEYYLDTTLQVYGDKASTDLLAQSDIGSWAHEFVAIDSNHRALGTYFARVSSPVKYYDYVIEQVQGSAIVGDGAVGVPMPGSSQVEVRDTLLIAGKSYRFVLVPEAGKYMQGGLFIMGSDPAVPSSWVQPRAASLASKSGAVNEAIVVDFTATRTDRYGLVIVNEGGSGTFMLQRLPLS